jgi:predicted ATPase
MYNPQEHHDLGVRYGNDLGVGAHGFLSWSLWQLGYPDQAMQHSEKAHILAQNLSHPYSLSFARVSAAFLYHFRRDALATHEQAEATRTLTAEQGFVLWWAVGTILHGWALAMQGQEEVGIAEMRQGIAAELATGEKTHQAHFLGLLAERYGEVGRLKEGLDLLTEALAVIDTTEARYYEAELHRLKGELLLQQSSDNAPEAETCFYRAISIAQNQSAKSWELRASTSLSKLWRSQGKRAEALELLEPVYSWFTEGFDTADLIDAKALLDELA